MRSRVELGLLQGRRRLLDHRPSARGSTMRSGPPGGSPSWAAGLLQGGLGLARPAARSRWAPAGRPPGPGARGAPMSTQICSSRPATLMPSSACSSAARVPETVDRARQPALLGPGEPDVADGDLGSLTLPLLLLARGGSGVVPSTAREQEGRKSRHHDPSCNPFQHRLSPGILRERGETRGTDPYLRSSTPPTVFPKPGERV